MDLVSYQKGACAADIDMDELIFNKDEFTKYVIANHFPFKNKFYKIKAGVPLDLTEEDSHDNFGHFLQFIKDDFGIDISLPSNI